MVMPSKSLSSLRARITSGVLLLRLSVMSGLKNGNMASVNGKFVKEYMWERVSASKKDTVPSS